jgi:hypothetical protein
MGLLAKKKVERGYWNTDEASSKTQYTFIIVSGAPFDL